MTEQENILLYSLSWFGPLPTPLPQVFHLCAPPPALILSVCLNSHVCCLLQDRLSLQTPNEASEYLSISTRT